MNQQKTNRSELESLSSISVDPNLRDFSSTIFGGRKSSFEYVNILKDSQPLPKKECRNSLDILASDINGNKANHSVRRSILEVYNEENKVKIEHEGFQPLQIGEVYSQSQDGGAPLPKKQASKKGSHSQQLEEKPLKLETVFNDVQFSYHSYFPKDLATVLKQREIPFQYVRGLLMARNLKEIKSTRRLKVQRYLLKRRKKTWNRKICYNCRQKVAEERLRIKGKFIKKRRALEILGLKQPISLALLKEKLYAALKNKDAKQLEQLIKNEDKAEIEGNSNPQEHSSIIQQEEQSVKQQPIKKQKVQ